MVSRSMGQILLQVGQMVIGQMTVDQTYIGQLTLHRLVDVATTFILQATTQAYFATAVNY
jgi:hypothetical protein